MLLFFGLNAIRAQNLINNGGFETFTYCPEGINENGVILAPPWQCANTQSSPYYFNSCAPQSSCCGMPVQFSVGYQYPNWGNGLVAFAAYSFTHPNVREYLRYPLSNTLKSGTTYCLTFYVNLFNESHDAIDAIGAYFTDSALICPTLFCLLNYPAQVNNAAGNILSDTLGWMQITGCFTAQCNENYMLIGNFKTDAQTQTAISSG